MDLEIFAPNVIDAIPMRDASDKHTTIYNLNFYKGRPSSYGPILKTTDKNGNTLSCAAIKISEKGRIQLERLSTSIEPEADRKSVPGTAAEDADADEPEITG